MIRLRVRAKRILVLLTLLLGGVSFAASAQDALPQPAESIDSASAVGSAAVAGSDPLPAPSFTRAYWHVFLAFAFAWVLLLAYAVHLDRRVAGAADELKRLGERR